MTVKYELRDRSVPFQSPPSARHSQRLKSQLLRLWMVNIIVEAHSEPSMWGVWSRCSVHCAAWCQMSAAKSEQQMLNLNKSSVIIWVSLWVCVNLQWMIQQSGLAGGRNLQQEKERCTDTDGSEWRGGVLFRVDRTGISNVLFREHITRTCWNRLKAEASFCPPGGTKRRGVWVQLWF